MKAVLLNEGLVRRPRMTEFGAAEIPSLERPGSKAKLFHAPAVLIVSSMALSPA
jgi:hypothetical protein